MARRKAWRPPKARRIPKKPKSLSTPRLPRLSPMVKPVTIAGLRRRRSNRGLFSQGQKFSNSARRTLKFKSPLEAALVLGLFAASAFIPQILAFGQQNPIEAVIVLTIPIDIAIVVVYLKVRKRRQRQQALRAVQLADVDSMFGKDFERYVAALFRHHGYKVEETGRTGDQGCDLILSRDGEKIVCQIKRYEAPVSNKAIQEAVTAVAIYNCHRSMVVTNSSFTKGAIESAAANNCELIDREQLGKLIASFRANVG